MNRREFCRASGMMGAVLALPITSPARSEASMRLTTISYNVLACRGYPDTDANKQRRTNAQHRMAERMALELALYQPDLVTFHESPSESVVGEIAAALKMNHAWFPGGWPGNADWPGGFPGTIISRYPIINNANRPTVAADCPEDLFTRHWCRATLETPAGALHVFSAHLHPSEAALREREVTEILKVIEPELAAGHSLIFQGDLNHRPDGPEYARWTGAGLVDTLAHFGATESPTFSSVEPRGRIDYIWAGGPIAAHLRESRVLFEGEFRTNPEDPASFALSDHLPVLAKFGD